MSKLPEMIAEVAKFDIDDVSALAAALESNAYARERMTGTPRFPDRFKLLKYATSRVTLQGLLMEFGVNDGSTLRYIAEKFPYRPVYGFDSFEGLPEA